MDIDNISFRAFSHATENEDRVKKAVINVSKSEDLTCSKSCGYHGNPITIIETKITHARDIKDFLISLSEEDIKQLIDTIDLRVDDESFFYMRLDKQEAYLGNPMLNNGEDVISVKGKIKSYPQNRENNFVTFYNDLYIPLNSNLEVTF